MSVSRELNFKRAFTNELRAVPNDVADQVREKVDVLLEDPIPDGKLKKKLKTKKDLYRLRVGDYRVFYTFGDTWVRLLGVRRRNERTFTDKIDSLEVDGPQSTPVDDDDLDEILGGSGQRSEPFRMSTESAGPKLPRPITIEWLRQLKVPVSHFPALVACRTEQELVSVAVPVSVLETVLDNLFPQPIVEVEKQPDFVARSTDDLVRYRNGDLVAFLLKLDDDQLRLTDWALNGPTMVKGGAGTGKSTVALYRAKRLLERPNQTGKERLLFTTYTRALVKASQQLLKQLLSPEQFQRVTVETCDEVARGIVASTRRIGAVESGNTAQDVMKEVRSGFEPKGTSVFEKRLRARALEGMADRYLLEEFEWIIEGRGLKSLGEYKVAPRPGRGVALRDGAREAVWELHEAYVQEIHKRKLERFAALRSEAREIASGGKWKGHFDFVLVDEAQDLTPAALCLMAEVAKTPEGLFFAADGRQSLYSRNYSWTAVHPRLQFTGRTAILRRNYRSTEEIDRAASEVLGGDLADEGPSPQSIHNGPLPILLRGVEPEDEAKWVSRFVREMARHLRMPVSSAAVLAPTNEVAASLAEELALAGLPARFFKGRDLDLNAEAVKVMTLHSAKGLEFPMVVIAGFRQGVTRGKASFADEDTYSEWLRNQRKLLYVGMTRAMRGLMVSVPAGCEHEALCSLSGSSWAVEAGS